MSIEILLLSCYELGHQPLSLAWPAAVLRAAGHSVAVNDLAVEGFNVPAARAADVVGIAVPMHTALRLGVTTARRIRRLNREAHIVFYGLYAWMNRNYLLHSANGSGPLADSVIGGEIEAPLQALIAALDKGEPVIGVDGVKTAHGDAEPHLARLTFPVPDRTALPGLDHYARYMHNGRALLAGYVESSRGCLHTCRHCPVVPVYGGRFFVVPVETVLADIEQQVSAGARHITFGDPDFLNGPGHAVQVARALHEAHPDVTFDFTTKVEHILERRQLFPELRKLGARFVVSAFEATSDLVLRRLHKGHTVADMDEALAILAEAGLDVQPTWVSFTPWTSLDDYLRLLAWIRKRALIPHVPAVQLSIRLLVPPHSALLAEAETSDWLGPLSAEDFTHTWRHPDPRMDDLQVRVAQLAAEAGNDTPYETYRAVEALAYAAAGRQPPAWTAPAVPDMPPPRLTEDWFC